MFKKAKILCVLLSIVLLITACAKNGNTDNNNNNNNNNNGNIIGTTEHKLVTNGNSEYKVVIPALASSFEIDAANELILFFKEATNIELQLIQDSDLSFTANDKYISLGNTHLFETSGITKDKSITSASGYIVVTKDKSIFIKGGESRGTLYGVYELLHHLFGFEVYFHDEIAINKGVTSLELPLFNVLDIPDIDWRERAYGSLYQVDNFSKRLRMHSTGDVWITKGGQWNHTSFQYVAPSLYSSAHPEWYGASGKQLCYTAHGDEESLELMRQVAITEMKNAIIANPNAEQMMFGQEDYAVWCTCDSCSAEREKYGSNAAVLIKFLNPVAREIKQWLDSEHNGRKLQIVTFAYNVTESAPAKKNASGEFEPFDQSVKMEDNLSIMYAAILSNYFHDFYAPINSSTHETLKAWRSISNELYMWTYSTNFRYYLLPFNSMDSMQEIYRFLIENETKYLFDQSQYTQKNATAFHNLKLYLNAKLQWDVNLNLNELIDNFFKNYFKDAAVPMKKMYDHMHLWLKHLETEQGLPGDCLDSGLLNVRYWPYATLNGWLDIIDEAYAAIEPLKTQDNSLYLKLADRITLESLMPRYILIQLHSGKYTQSQLLNMKQSFKADAVRVDVTQIRENTSISTLFTSWGV